MTHDSVEELMSWDDVDVACESHKGSESCTIIKFCDSLCFAVFMSFVIASVAKGLSIAQFISVLI